MSWLVYILISLFVASPVLVSSVIRRACTYDKKTHSYDSHIKRIFAEATVVVCLIGRAYCMSVRLCTTLLRE